MVTRQSYIEKYGIWAVLMPPIIMFSGLFVGGYAIIDEIVLVLAILICMKYVKRDDTHDTTLSVIHKTVFNMLILYFLFEAVRGAIVYYYEDGFAEALRKVRWIIMFASIGIFSNIVYHMKIDRVGNKIIMNTLFAGIAYFIFYIAYGAISQLVFGINRYQMQFAQSGSIFAIWTTTAYAMYPIVAVLPAVYVCLKQLDKKYHKYGYLALLAIFFAALYYDSRSGLIVSVFFSVLLLISMRKDRALYVLIISLVALVIYISINPAETFYNMLDDLASSGGSLWSFGSDYTVKKDLDRTIQIVASLNSISESAPSFLFGYGYAVSGKIIGLHFYDLAIAYQNYKFGGNFSNFGTEFIPAILVDGGVVGFLLLLANIGLSMLVIARSKNSRNKLIMIVMICVAFLWGFVINIHDAVLFYCIIMPRGIMFQFGGVGIAQKDELPEILEAETPESRRLMV